LNNSNSRSFTTESVVNTDTTVTLRHTYIKTSYVGLLIGKENRFDAKWGNYYYGFGMKVAYQSKRGSYSDIEYFSSSYSTDCITGDCFTEPVDSNITAYNTGTYAIFSTNVEWVNWRSNAVILSPEIYTGVRFNVNKHWSVGLETGVNFQVSFSTSGYNASGFSYDVFELETEIYEGYLIRDISIYYRF
jgi:hypothetical protein